MRRTTILLPDSAKEFLAQANGLDVEIPVIMGDMRVLRLKYSLLPRVCSDQYIPEDAKVCPGCGLSLRKDAEI